MTRTPPPAERGETEDRLILLCAVGALGTSTEDQLLRFAVEAFRLDPSPDELKLRIARRADAMLGRGWIDEARAAIGKEAVNA